MGTPLKSLSVVLSPKVLSPLSSLSPRSQNQLEGLLKNEKLKLHPHLAGETRRLNHAVRKLDFSHFSPVPKLPFESVHIEISDYSEDVVTRKDVVINTPNKQNIIKNGLATNKNLNILGKGSFGQVIRGIYREQIVAVKVMKRAPNLREKNALGLSHLNVVRTIDIIENDKENFSLVVMEYFPDSRQLQSLLENFDMSLENEVVNNFAKQICKGVEYCHKNGILHLDIKPLNILVCGNTCKICDFGNSVRMSETKGFIHQGTVFYTAPELLQGRQPTEKCDIYSLGILFWQLRFRISPYCDSDNVETVIYKVVKCNWRPENENPVDEYSKLYQQCWHMDPEKRPLVSDILGKLENCC